jgi:hypothetical protein
VQAQEQAAVLELQAAAAGAGSGEQELDGAVAARAAAVAGVQLASRQHSSLVPFFQTSSLVPLRQLSMVWAPAAVASAAEANSIATLFSFFMVLLLGKKPQQRCVTTTTQFKVTITKNVRIYCATRSQWRNALIGRKAPCRT